MSRSRWRSWHWLAISTLFLLLVPALAACGSSGTGNGSAKKIKVGLVTDIGGLNDKGFNHLADVGLTNAMNQLGIQGAVKESHSGDDYVPNLTSFATQGYDLVIAVGFLMGPAVGQVSAQFPNTKFALIDSDPTDAKGNSVQRSNVESLLFHEEDAGALVGVIAGMMEKNGTDPNKTNTISAVGGQNIPPVAHYIAGYQWAAKMEDPNVKVLVGFSQDFTDPTKCLGVANSQISAGSDIVFQVAGGCGLGALQAAGQHKVYSIGVDTDQKSSDPSVIASAVKRVDTATFDAIQQVQQNKFTSGETFFDLKNGGVGYTPGNITLSSDITAEVMKVEGEIKAGTLTPPAPATIPQS